MVYLSSCLFFFCFLLSTHPIQALPKKFSESAITCDFNRGRFADRLKSCIMAFWLSYKNNIPFLFKPFERSELIKIHHTCKHYSEKETKKYKNKKVFTGSDELIFDKKSCLYSTTFSVDAHIDWYHDRDYIKEFICPAGDWKYLELPNDKPTIAIHIRRGSMEDARYRRDLYETRKQRGRQFPSIDYYISALQILLNRIEGCCYIHLFTDDPKPEILANALLKSLNKVDKKRIALSWHNPQESYTQDPVLQDFFDMMRFNYLIKPCSNFSKHARLLGSHSLVLEPIHALEGSPWGIVTALRIIHQDFEQKIFFTEEISLVTQ